MSEQVYADSVWLNGTVLTVDAEFGTASALAVNGTELLYVGSNKAAQKFVGPQTKVHELNGATVVPGFIESHMHLQAYGESLLKLPIRDKSKHEILQMVAKAVKDLPPGQWLEGGMGWNNEVWEEPSYPTMEELDAVAPNNPVLLPRMDGHLIWANSLAFAKAGVDNSTPNPDGGEFMRKADGSLLGCAGNAAAAIIRAAVPLPDEKARKKALLAAQEKLLQYGITTLCEMSTNWDNVCDLKELYANKTFKPRFYGALHPAALPNAAEQEQAYFTACPEVDLFDEHYTVRAVKILTDGSVGAQSAALLEEYTDRPGHYGTLMYTDEELYAMVSKAAEKGMQVICHAIGDAAIEQVLRVYKRVLEDYPTPDHRFRIEHFQTVAGNSREKARELGVVASMQPAHAPNSAGMAVRRLGKERAEHAYAMGYVLQILGKVAGGSDAPVAPPNPMDGIHAAVTRQNAALQPEGGFYKQNAISREDALRAYTVWGAQASFTEKRRGSLEKGKLADFVVLNNNLLEVQEHEILNIKPLETVIGGEVVFSSESDV